MPEEQSFKRITTVDRRVSEIKPEDIRIRILGTVVDKEGDSIALDDGTGKINIRFDAPVSVDVNQLVRVFGRVIAMDKGFELQGEIVQDMGKLDMDLYKKVFGVEKNK